MCECGHSYLVHHSTKGCLAVMEKDQKAEMDRCPCMGFERKVEHEALKEIADAVKAKNEVKGLG